MQHLSPFYSRPALAPYRGRRIRVAGTVDGFGRCVCLRELTLASTGALLADHVWIKGAGWADGAKVGDRIEIDAKVVEYVYRYTPLTLGLQLAAPRIIARSEP
jgi:hypothetical protein